VRENLRNFFKDKLFTTTIPRNIRLAEAPSYGKPILVYDPKSKGAEAYQDLATELLKRHGVEVKAPAKKLILDEIPPVSERPIISTPKGKRVWPFGRE
jgi:chromosome partitioning protein